MCFFYQNCAPVSDRTQQTLKFKFITTVIVLQHHTIPIFQSASFVSETVFPSNFVNQRLLNPATIKPAPLWLYLRLSFMQNSKHSSSADPSPLIVCMHYHFMTVLLLFDPAMFYCSSSHIQFHCYHPPSHHSLQFASV